LSDVQNYVVELLENLTRLRSESECIVKSCARFILFTPKVLSQEHFQDLIRTSILSSTIIMVSGHLANVTKPPEFETLALHGAQEPDPTNGSRAVPLYQTCAYNFESAADGASKFAWSKDGYVYTRMGNPTTAVFEQRMAMLEGGVGAVASASGHSAQFMAITSICEPGHNFVSTMNLYGGTFNQFRVYFKKFNIACKFVEGQDPAAIKGAIDGMTRAVYIETIGNPQFNVPDIRAIADVCHEAGIPLIVDNTFGMGGYLCKPISFGADIVTHSCTKWIGGHGTSMGGIVIDGGHFDWSKSGKFPCM
jgi:O-acetylhomoserine/O-acetylserine sulfhydrylase